MTDQPIHSWKAVLGNKFLIKPRSEMLTTEGYILPRVVGIEGERKSAPRHPRLFRYDREYVVAYFASQLELLNDEKWNALQEIISEAYKQSKQQGDIRLP